VFEVNISATTTRFCGIRVVVGVGGKVVLVVGGKVVLVVRVGVGMVVGAVDVGVIVIWVVGGVVMVGGSEMVGVGGGDVVITRGCVEGRGVGLATVTEGGAGVVMTKVDNGATGTSEKLSGFG
jgi:hypothetical protein